MSDDAETADDAGPSVPARLAGLLEDWYHLPVLAVILGVMAWIRQRSWGNFIVDGTVYFGGNDPWYHFRQIVYTVEHWPQTMPYDLWTNFALGTDEGQFGTLFDQAIATAALVYGGGDPTLHQIRLVTMFAPVVIGALVALPTYAIGKRLGNRLTGLLAAGVLALLPGVFLSRSTVGTADHNIAEPLFMSTALLALLVAVAVAEREKPVWEQLSNREFGSLRTVAGYSTLAGIATALYLYVWPPGVMLVGIFGVFVLVKMTSDAVDATSPEHVGIAAAVSMGVAGVLLMVPLDVMGFSASQFSLLQVLFPLGVAAGAAYVSWLAREFESRDIDDAWFPGAVLGTLAVSVGVVAVAIPSLYRMVTANLLRFVGFSAGAQFRTIGEAQPFPLSTAQRYGLSGPEVIFHEYGFAFFLAVAAIALLLLVPLLRSRDNRKVGLAVLTAAVTGFILGYPDVLTIVGDVFAIDGSIVGVVVVGALLAAVGVYGTYDGERMLLVTWTLFLIAAAFTQVRFNYYLAVPVAVLAAYLPFYVLDQIGYSIDREAFLEPDVNAYLTVGVVLLVLVAPLAVPVGLTNDRGQTLMKQPAWEVTNGSQPGAVTRWSGTLDWMQHNTPAVGAYGGADNADRLDYYGSYAQPPDGNYDYPKGAYGVMSWWDYGHWITVLGHRVPVANPFQQHATLAANYLLSPTEQQASAVLEKVNEDDATVRYVAVDWKMVVPGSKFGAPVVFYTQNESLNRADLIEGQIYHPQQQQWITLKSQRYYDSQVVRLYRYMGSARRAQPLVTDYELRSYKNVQRQIPTFNGTRRFDTMAQAREYVRQDPTSRIGGISDYPAEDVPALEHYRLVAVSEKHFAPANYFLRSPELNYGNFPTWVKLFERVPGATVHGTAPPNTTVKAAVQLSIPFPKKAGNFTYKQYAQTGQDGEFTMTLPYSSTGYENWGVEEGYTNVSVRATGPYVFTTPNVTYPQNVTTVRFTDTAHVTEGQVIGENDSIVQVELTKEIVDRPEGATNSTANQSALAPIDPVATGPA